jgi:hypothetical protein
MSGPDGQNGLDILWSGIPSQPSDPGVPSGRCQYRRRPLPRAHARRLRNWVRLGTGHWALLDTGHHWAPVGTTGHHWALGTTGHCRAMGTTGHWAGREDVGRQGGTGSIVRCMVWAFHTITISSDVRVRTCIANKREQSITVGLSQSGGGGGATPATESLAQFCPQPESFGFDSSGAQLVRLLTSRPQLAGCRLSALSWWVTCCPASAGRPPSAGRQQAVQPQLAGRPQLAGLRLSSDTAPPRAGSSRVSPR